MRGHGSRHGSVCCWVQGCRGWATDSTSVELTPGRSVTVVLCVPCEQAIREQRALTLVEELPPAVEGDADPRSLRGQLVVVR